MGIRTALQLFTATAPAGVSATAGRARREIVSPWAEGALEKIALADVFGLDYRPVTRAEAMTVPAVAKARWLICTPLSKHPLRAYRTDELVAADSEARDPRPVATPAWLYRTSGNIPPQFRILWTLDDLLFTGFSLWAVTRGAKGQITDAVRVAREWWHFDEQYRIQIADGAGGYYTPGPRDVILFTSPQDPLLECAERTIRGARDLEEVWTARVRNPIPVAKIRQTEDIELDEVDEDGEEVDALAEGYDIAKVYLKQRHTPEGSVVVVPYGWDLEEMGSTEPSMFIEGRNAVALDVGRFTGLPSSLLEATQTQASLTYSTKEGDRSLLADYSLAIWAMAIEARLSMDDVVPAGQSVRFDLAWNTAVQPTTNPLAED